MKQTTIAHTNNWPLLPKWTIRFINQLQGKNQSGIGSELEVQARKAIETNNDGLMVVPTDALDSATARLIVEEVWWSNLKRHNDRFFSNLNGNSSEQPKNPKNL